MRYLLFFLTSAALATNIPITFVGATNTQAVFSYTAPDAAACTVSATTADQFLPEVYDLDASLFTGSNLDIKTGNVTNGLQRTIVVGHRTAGVATDGNAYSLALAVYSNYTLNLSCDGGANTGTVNFKTDNLRLGDTGPDWPDYDTTGTQWMGWLWPTLNYNQEVNVIDPHSGIPVARLTGPGQDNSFVNNGVSGANGSQCWPDITDIASAWTGVNNIGCVADGAFATYSGSAGAAAALFISQDQPFGQKRPSYLVDTWDLAEDVKFSLQAKSSTGSDHISVCISADYGVSCVGSPIDNVIGTTSTLINFPTSGYPNPTFHAWGDAKVTPDMVQNQYSGSISSIIGNTVTWGSNPEIGGNLFFPVTQLKPGWTISISGTAPTCPLNKCTIASITDQLHVKLVQTFASWSSATISTLSGAISAGATTLTVANGAGYIPDPKNGSNINFAANYILTIGADTVRCTTLSTNTFSSCTGVNSAHASGVNVGSNTYSFENFGFKLWKSSGSGTVSVDSLYTNHAGGTSYYTGFDGGGGYCNKTAVSVAWDKNNNPITPVSGYTCILSGNNLGHYILTLFIPSTGESRYISPFVNLSVNPNISIPTQWFAYNTATNQADVCNYNVSLGHWQGMTPYSYFSTGNNPNLTCAPIITTSIKSEIQAAYPNIDFSYFPDPIFQVTGYNAAICPGGPQTPGPGVPACDMFYQITTGQGALSYFCTVDVNQPPGAGQVTQCVDSWSQYPLRWVGEHGSGSLQNSGYTSIGVGSVLGDVNGCSATCIASGGTGIERWDLDINTIYNNGGVNSLTNTFVDPSVSPAGNCQALITAAGGGTIDPRWVTAGALNNCFKMNVPRDPVAKTPTTQDRVPLGSIAVGARPGAWVHNSTACGGDNSTPNCWSFLQSMAPGDWIQDQGNTIGGEKFLIVYEAAVGSTIDVILARGLNPWNCRGNGAGMTAHTSIWIPIMMATNSCGTLNFLFPTGSGTAVGMMDNPALGVAHVGGFTNSASTNYQYLPGGVNYPVDLGASQSGYGIRSGPFPGVVGQGIGYGSSDYYGYGTNGRALDFSTISFFPFSQSHPGGGSQTPPLNNENWAVDGRPLGGSGGGTTFLWFQNPTLVSGQTHTWKISLPLSAPAGSPLTNGGNWTVGLKTKLHPTAMHAGYHLLQDISGPSTIISDSTPWSGCIANAAGECAAGSVKGNAYVSVPSADTSGQCEIDGQSYWLCLESVMTAVGQYTQYDVTGQDPWAANFRNLGYFFNGPGRTDNFANIHTIPTGDFGVVAVKWGNGQFSNLYAVRYPVWPNKDSTARYQPVMVPVSVTGGAGVTVRARFGYDTNFYCSQRREACSTALPTATPTDPYSWLSEPQTWQTCTTTCTVLIPAQSERVLYYAIDTQVGAVITSGPLMPPIPVN